MGQCPLQSKLDIETNELTSKYAMQIAQRRSRSVPELPKMSIALNPLIHARRSAHTPPQPLMNAHETEYAPLQLPERALTR